MGSEPASRDHTWQAPLPRRLDRERAKGALTGREAELGDLRDEFERAAAGRRLAVVEGEAGIGRTRLVAELASDAHALGSFVLSGRASDGMEKPYLPFIEAFGDCVDHAPPEFLEGAAGELAELARLVPEAADLLGESTIRKDSPASEQFALFRASLALLRLLSAERPVLLVLEDLQWADPGSLLMLQHLLSGRGDFRGLVVATWRPESAAGNGPLARALTQLAREPGYVRVHLPGLSSRETLALLGEIAGHGAGGHDEGVAEAVHAQTLGNPLLVSELVRSLLESGTLVEVEGRWRLTGDLDAAPVSRELASAIAQRVRTLGDGAEEALSLAASADAEFDPEAVELALEVAPGELAEVWDVAERSGLLEAVADGARVRFRQPLVRRALAHGVGIGSRGRTGRRLTAWGDGRGVTTASTGVLERTGDHWSLTRGERSVTLRDGKGVRYLARLLAAPGLEIHAADLQAGASSAGVSAGARQAVASGELGVRAAGAADAGAVLDETAKRAYRERIAELESEIEEADGFNDVERAARAREELDFVGRELSAAVGLGGRDRKAASEAERARVNVTRAIRGVVARIGEHDERLGRELKAAVSTGTFCRYEPLPGQELVWAVRGIDG